MSTKRSQFFEVITNEAIMGIAVFEPVSDRCVYINRLAREVLEMSEGSEHEGYFPLILNELFPQDVRSSLFARPLKPEMLLNEGLFQDVLLRKQTGAVIIANVGVRHVAMDDGSPGLLLMFQDITIQKKLQREVLAKQEEIHRAFTELLEQNRQLKELDSAKDKFIALTSHELRTPLAAIVATAEVLELKLYETNEERESFIRTIHEQGRHLMDLVNDILDFAKIRAGKLDYYIDQIELRPLVEQLLRSFEMMAAQEKVTLSFTGSNALVFADALRLKEVLGNVVNNAIKYNRPGGSVVVALEEGEGFVRISVRDTGVGIAESKIENVFNEFETVGSVSLHHKGTGLGMPISKRLIQTMGGDISLKSEVGVGTTFFIDIPTTKVLAPEMYGARPDSRGDFAA